MQEPDAAPEQQQQKAESAAGGAAPAFAALAVVLALAAVIGVVAWRSQRPAPPPAAPQVEKPVEIPNGAPIPDFTLTDQRGRPMRRADMDGKVWVVGFVFTRCPSTCPLITTSMKKLAAEITDPDVGFLSISVDPTYDDTEVLNAYAADFGADPARWRFLTGDPKVVHDLVVRGFKTALKEVPKRPEQIIHSDRLAIVDRKGVVRAYVHGTLDESVAGVPAKVKELLAER